MNNSAASAGRVAAMYAALTAYWTAADAANAARSADVAARYAAATKEKVNE